MNTNFDLALQRVLELSEDFHRGRQLYLSADYTEAAIRQDFLDKFFTALGWDVGHNIQKNPYQQEVKVERSVSDSISKRRADYAFFIEPDFRNPRFYVEAKKPSTEIDSPDYYFQTIRYGWNSSTPLAVLTDFEQFRVLYCGYPSAPVVENDREF